MTALASGTAVVGTTGGRACAGPFIAIGIHEYGEIRGQSPPAAVGFIPCSIRSLDTAHVPPTPIAPGSTPVGASELAAEL